MSKQKGKPHRLPQVHNRELFLEVLPGHGEDPIKTSTVQKRAVERWPEYSKATNKWFREILNSYSVGENPRVAKIKRVDDKADYWRLF